MAGDRVAEYLISFGGDANDLNALFSNVKASARSTFSDLQAQANKLDLFGTISDNLPKVQSALDRARSEVKKFNDEIDKIKGRGETPTKDLTEGLKAAEKAAASAAKELARQEQQLASLGAQLTKAGVNTRALAAEQTRLAEASKVAAEAATVTAAKQQLGLVTLKDIAPEVTKARAAYDALKASGTLSASEIAAAQQKLDAKIKELQGTVTKTGGSFKTLQTETSDLFSGLALKVVGAVAVIGTVTAALQSVTGAAKAFKQSLAEVGAVTNLAQGDLQSLGKDVRALSVELGIDATQALKGVIELLRSGVSKDNVIDVLRESAVASKAAVTDLGEGVKAANVLLDGFGLKVEDLPRAFDTIIQGAKEGGATLSEFANAFGPLANIAQANNISLEQVTATLAVMIDKGIDAGQAASDLGKIIQKLGSSEVRGKLVELGVSSKDLVGIFTELGKRGKGLDEVLSLGIGNAKNAAAIATLTNNSGELQVKLDAVTTAAGGTKKAFDQLADSPTQIKEKFNATFAETLRQLGELIGTSSSSAVAVTKLADAFNVLPDQMKRTAVETGNFGVLAGLVTANLFGLVTSATKAKDAVAAVAPAADATAAALDKINKAIAAPKSDVETFTKALQERVAALVKASSEEVAAIDARVQAEIDALDKSTAANVASSQKAADLLKAAAKEKIQIAEDTEKQINVATKAAVDARIALGREANEKQSVIDAATLQLRIAGNGQVLASYRALYADLEAQAKASAATINSIDAQRVAFNEGLETSIRNIRLDGLTGLQQFAEKQAEVDKLIAKARQVAATEGIAAAQKYFDQAKTLAESVTKAVTDDGVEVVSQFQAQQAKLEGLKKVGAAYNEELSKASDSAKAGAEGTKTELDLVSTKIKELSKNTLALQKQLADGLTIKVKADEESLAIARAHLDKLVESREVLIRVKYVGADGAPAPSPEIAGPPAPGFNRGGPVWKQYAQRFASGGPVFRPLSSWKVPGSGNGDTVPARLASGSFVVRKSSVQKYGDGMMSRLANGYASGGAVINNENAAAAFEYSKYIRQFLRHPIFEQSRATMDRYIRDIQRNGLGNIGEIENLLASAVFAANNFQLQDFFGKTSSAGGSFLTKRLPGFEEWLKARPKPAQFAEGGAARGTDTVPAWLTPGEVVLTPPAVRALGLDFLNAVNKGSFVPPRPQYFAQGGIVGPSAVASPASGGAGLGGDTFHFHIDNAGGDLTDPRVQRKLATALTDMMRRSGWKPGVV